MQSNSDEEDNDLCDNSRDSDYLIDFFLNDNEIDNDNESIDLPLPNERFDADGLILSPNDFNDYVTSINDSNLQMNNREGFEEAIILQESTNTGEFVYEVQGNEHEKKGIKKDITINGHVILNQCGFLLTRKSFNQRQQERKLLYSKAMHNFSWSIRTINVS